MMGGGIKYHSVNIQQLKQFGLHIVYAEIKNSGLRRSVSRCNSLR